MVLKMLPRWPSSAMPASQAPFCGMATLSVSLVVARRIAPASAKIEGMAMQVFWRGRSSLISSTAMTGPKLLIILDSNDLLRPPQTSSSSRTARIAALDYEIAQEQVSALGRMGRALEAALTALAEYDRSRGVKDAARDSLVRRRQRRVVGLHGPARGDRLARSAAGSSATIACPPRRTTAWAPSAGDNLAVRLAVMCVRYGNGAKAQFILFSLTMKPRRARPPAENGLFTAPAASNGQFKWRGGMAHQRYPVPVVELETTLASGSNSRGIENPDERHRSLHQRRAAFFRGSDRRVRRRHGAADGQDRGQGRAKLAQRLRRSPTRPAMSSGSSPLTTTSKSRARC